MQVNIIHNEECLSGLKKLPDNSIDCCVTSPPYYGLRDYGTSDQIGLEPTPDLYIEKLTDVFMEVRRVLKPSGTLWLNIGDSYAAPAKNRTKEQAKRKSTLNGSTESQVACRNHINKRTGDLKHKDLIGIPWMLAFALRSSGYYLRQEIIWHKPNPMPESVTDRCTKSHESIFLLSKSAKYFYDHVAIMQDVAISTVDRLSQDLDNQKGSARVPGKANGNMKASWNGSTFTQGKTGEMMITRGGRKSGNKYRKNDTARGCPENSSSNVCGSVPWEGLKANKRSVWTVSTKPFKEAHFATFPEDLIVDCIKAGCPDGGIVLDPFIGAGTTAIVAAQLNRKFIGFEINKQYTDIARKRLKLKLGFFNPSVEIVGR